MIKILKTERHDKHHGGYFHNIIVFYINEDGIKKLITFYQHPTKKSEWGTEVYSGKNYIVGSHARSYSRNYYKWKDLPKKYLDIAKKLRKIHKKTYK